jgi:hypothetical protein
MSISSASAAELIMSGYQETVQAAAAAPAAAAAAAAAPQDFCTLWPKAKPILQLLVGIIAFLPIPGGGAAGGGILNGLIMLGDKIHKDQCGG